MDEPESSPALAVPGQRRGSGRSRHTRSTGRAGSRSRRYPRARALRKGAGESRQKLILGLIPVLTITLVFVLRNPLKVSAVPPGQSTPSGGNPASATFDPDIDWKIPPLYVPGTRDPMQLPQPPLTPTAGEAAIPPAPVQTRVNLTVSGILYSHDRPAAIIDTRLVHEGTQVSGATVKKIEIDGVEFEMNGQTWKQAVDE